MENILLEKMCEKYEEYLVDESKFQGWADSISFPENAEEVCRILRQMERDHIPVTIQGGKTGITGGAIPQGGHILNLSRMNQVLDADSEGCTITVEPGIPLMDLKKEILKRFGRQKLFWPVQPTEESATVGGVAAVAAQGPNSLYYGSSKKYITGVKMACCDGTILEFDRERDGEKLDQILGGEGIAGVLVSLTLKLIPKPEDIWGICFFFEEEEKLAAFADAFRENSWNHGDAWLTTCEYLDKESIRLIQERKQDMAKIRELPDVDEKFQSMVYLELEGSPDSIEELAEELMELAAEYESDPEEAWALSGEIEVERLRAFRHAAAESVNLCVEANRKETPILTKLAVDYKNEKSSFSELLAYYREGLAQSGLNHVIFGHIADGHLHVNLLPKTEEEYERGIGLLRSWAEELQKKGGVLVGEHGIGKLKKNILSGLLPKEKIDGYRELKKQYDPGFLLNPGDISDWEEEVCG